MYRNTARLGQTMASLADRFGVESLLVDPGRTRGLLLDEYGPAARSEISDIDEFVSALTSGTGDLVQHAEPVELAAGRLMRRTALSQPDALWTVSTLRSIATAAPHSPPPPPSGSPVPPPPRSSVLPPSTSPVPPPPAPQRNPPGDPAQAQPQPLTEPLTEPGSSTKWPRNARRMLTAVGAVAVLAIAAGIIVGVRSGSSLDDARAERDQALTQLAALEAGSTVDQSQTADDAVDDDTASENTAGDSDAPSAELESQVAAQATTIEQQQAEIERLEAENAALASATAAPTPAPAPFSVEPAGVVPSTEEFSGNLALQECEGFSDACSPTMFLDPSFQREGEQIFVNLPNRARVPVASFDGLTFGGQATLIDSASFTCNGVAKVTNIAIQLSPVRFTIDPQTSSVTVTAYNALITRTSPADACTAAMSSYTGTITTG